MRLYFFLLPILGVCLFSCKKNQQIAIGTGNSGKDSVVVAFYNVENLYDVSDDPKTSDEDFTPEGKLKWNQERYEMKLSRLSEVLNALPGELPVFIGMAEVENRKVLEDLSHYSGLAQGHYGIIHQDSPDERGIDVAVLYDMQRMRIQDYQVLPVVLPDSTDHTRDILYVKAQLKNETMYFFINHWPSRRGGQVESEKNRIAAAQVLRSRIENIQGIEPQAKILVMGDFNDYPTDKSIAEILNAGTDASNVLFNYMANAESSGEGSYYYKGDWGCLDQFIGSKTLQNALKGYAAGAQDANIFKQELVLFKDDKGVNRPNHTYVGEDYKGGYSDHLPIYLILHK